MNYLTTLTKFMKTSFKRSFIDNLPPSKNKYIKGTSQGLMLKSWKK